MIQINLTMSLPNARQIGYAEYGDPKGYPVFFFHGFPGSRLQAGDFHDLAYAKHCRLIGVDRPGMGLSSPNKYHSLLSWSADISKLADHLNIDKFSIIAHSGGAPYALACADNIANRITQIALVSAMPPTTLSEISSAMPLGLRSINFLVRNIPGVAWLFMQLQQKVLLKPNMFKKIVQQLPEADRLICEKPEQINRMLSVLKEAFKQGVDGAVYEFRLISNDWGFNLKDIHTPVSIWQGALDKQILVAHAKFYQRELPNATLHLFEQDAHVSTLYKHMEEIMDQIISDQKT